MMTHCKNYWVVPVSLSIALVLTIMPLPPHLQPFRPDWLSLVVLYWGMAIPSRFGLGLACLFALLLDVSQGTLLGQHAFGLCLILYVVLRMHRQVRVSSFIQQALFIAVLLLLKQLLVLWVDGIVGRSVENLWLYFAPSLIGMLLWPFVFIILRDIRRSLHIR
ncbi:MAG: rod shape-determining protein MreD [Gammaproteobacteria bacterium]|nr:rod shape-determining protein MreD [Gammaproteobacteria bacterium]